jgi:dTMP kinase
MFIAMEGIDGCGKSVMGKALAEDLNFIYTREPTFTSEEADALNLESKNNIEREIEFAIDRIRHTNNVLRKWDDIICDRYIWTGLAYCSVYNPVAYPFAEALYKHKFFVKPDVYIFIETPIEICFQRKQIQPKEHLKKILSAYEKIRPIVETESKIITVSGVMKIQNCVKEIKDKMQNIFETGL